MKRLLIIISTILLLFAVPAGVKAASMPEEPKGEMIFIPDSLVGDIRRVLDGRSRIVRDETKVDPEELVVVRGDTVPLIIRELNLGRYDRGLFNYLFIPKGTWQFGLTASYGEIGTEDLRMGDILGDLDMSGHTFSIRPYVQYFLKNNLSVGFRLGYTSSGASLRKLQMDFDDDLNLDIHDVHYDDESYTAAVNFRQYIGLGRGSRFGIFNEMELAFSSGNASFVRPYDSKPKTTTTTYMEAQLSFSPGLCVFIMKNVSFNVSFGVFGFHFRNSKQQTDGEPTGNQFTSGANFRFNIFNINFGLGVHI